MLSTERENVDEKPDCISWASTQVKRYDVNAVDPSYARWKHDQKPNETQEP